MKIRHMVEPTEDGLIALCALLLEMAHIDGEFSEQEALLLVDLLSRQLAQSLVRGEALLHKARGQLRLAPDLDSLAARVRQEFEPPERAAILGLLWQVALVDGRLDAYEVYMMRRLGGLLGVSEEQLQEEQRYAAAALRESTRE